MIAKVPPVFDLKKNPKVIDGYLVKQIVFNQRGIKKFVQHQPTGSDKDYLFVATFTHKKPTSTDFDTGFKPETKAQAYQYCIEVYQMPKGAQLWK